MFLEWESFQKNDRWVAWESVIKQISRERRINTSSVQQHWSGCIWQSGSGFYLCDQLQSIILMGKDAVTASQWRKKCIERYGFHPILPLSRHKIAAWWRSDHSDGSSSTWIACQSRPYPHYYSLWVIIPAMETQKIPLVRCCRISYGGWDLWHCNWRLIQRLMIDRLLCCFGKCSWRVSWSLTCSML